MYVHRCVQDDGEVPLFYSDAAADTFRALNMQPLEKLCCLACGFSSRFSRVGSDEVGGSWTGRGDGRREGPESRA